MAHRVKGKLESMGKGAWTLLAIPRDVSERIGIRGKVPIKGTLDGVPFQGTLQPQGDGTHALPVTKDAKRASGLGDASVVEVVFDVDPTPRTVEEPPELSRALAAAPAKVRETYMALAPSHKRAWASWVAEAKKEETRERRAGETVRRLGEGEKNPKG